jgi:hypothetical protein
MEVADIDNDNDLDIILAALNFSQGVPDSTFAHWKEKNVPVLLLHNKTK